MTPVGFAVNGCAIMPPWWRPRWTFPRVDFEAAPTLSPGWSATTKVPRLFDRLPKALALAPNRFIVDGTTYDTDALFTVFSHAATEGKIAALLHPCSRTA